jgi:hypothetical protein
LCCDIWAVSLWWQGFANASYHCKFLFDKTLASLLKSRRLLHEYPPSHARVSEGVAKSQFPLQEVVFKSGNRLLSRF